MTDSKDAGMNVVQRRLMFEDECILVDETDRVLGHDSKYNCHLMKNIEAKNLLHRAFSVFLFNSKYELLLQKRQSTDPSPSNGKQLRTNSKKKKPVIPTPPKFESSNESSDKSRSSDNGSKSESAPPATSSSPNNIKQVKIEASSTRFQSIWSKEEVLLILQSVADYVDKNGKVPTDSDLEFFDNLKFEEKSFTQVSAKIRRLKAKYLRRVNRNGYEDEWCVGKPHEKAFWELAKKIWGTEHVVVRATKKSSQIEDDWFGSSYLLDGMVHVSKVDENEVKTRWRKLSLKAKKSFKMKCKAIQAKGFEWANEKMTLLNEFSTSIASLN